MNARIEAASDFQQRLAAIVGARGLITDAAEMAPYLSDWRALYAALQYLHDAYVVLGRHEIAALVRGWL